MARQPFDHPLTTWEKIQCHIGFWGGIVLLIYLIFFDGLKCDPSAAAGPNKRCPIEGSASDAD